MSIIRSLAKANERLEKAKDDSQTTEEKSPLKDHAPQINLTVPPQRSSGLGTLDYEATVENISSVVAQKRGNYKKYSETDRFQIGKYANENGNSKALIHFKHKFPGLKESTVRTFKKQYQEELQQAKIQKRSPSKCIKSKKRGRPLLLGGLDNMIKTFLRSTRAHGGVVNTAVAIAVAEALVKRYPEKELDHVQFRTRTWARSLFHRMGFVRRTATTGKVEIPEGARKEAELTFLHEIVNKVEQFIIPPSLILNLDQTNSKYVSVGNTTMAKRGSTSVPISGLSDKRSMTATFTITLSGSFLPMQLIYGGKTNQSLPKFDFPESFSLSANPKHYSNTAESIKLIKEVIVPYLEKERASLKLSHLHPSLLIMDVFRGQMTEDVLNTLKENNILLVRVPANMTHLFQPLDLTVNGNFKSFMRKRFSEWYSKQILQQLEKGSDVGGVKVDVKLSVIKPLHAKWLSEFYNYINSPDGQEVIRNAWIRAGILDAIKMGSAQLPSLDPFRDISSMANETEGANEIEEVNPQLVSPLNHQEDSSSDSDSDWDETEPGPTEENEDRNVFDLF